MDMALKPIGKRTLKNVGKNIWHAVSVMENRFGAELTHDSGHDKEGGEKATTWIFTFPKFGDAQVAVPMNREKLSLLVRGITVDGRELAEHLNAVGKVASRYTDSRKGVASSLLGSHAPFLNPSPENPLLRVIPNPDSVEELLALYLGVGIARTDNRDLMDASVASKEPSVSTSADEAMGRASRSHRAITAEELEQQLGRNSEIGRIGEEIAHAHEVRRLRERQCPEPEKFVAHVALTDVGRGYDIASTWAGEERYIEVKSTTRDGTDFFITENEWEVMSELREKGWLYRVIVGQDGGGKVVHTVPDPTRKINLKQRPVVWRVSEDALDLNRDASK
jgi:hypothetical protein